MNKIYLLIAVVFFAAGLGAGILLAGNLGGKNVELSDKYNAPDTFQAGWEAAKKKIEETPYISASKGEVKTIAGKIKGAEAGRIVMETRLLNPLDDEKLKTRIAVIGENTEIIIRQDKDMDQINKEHEEYNKKIEEFRQGKITVMPEAPELFSERKGSAQDLTEGRSIIVEAEENIKDVLEFKAKKITINL